MPTNVHETLTQTLKQAQLMRHGVVLPQWSKDTPICVAGSQWIYKSDIYIALKISGKDTDVGAIVPDKSLAYWKAYDFSKDRAIIALLVSKINVLERLRLAQIGEPRYHTSTQLPDNHAWINGDFISFADYPEFHQVYLNGGFSGMVLPYNATAEIKAANKGMFRPDAATPTGLYLPILGEEFLRCWTLGSSRSAGCSQRGAMKNLTGTFSVNSGTNYGTTTALYPIDNLSGVFTARTRDTNLFTGGGWEGCDFNKNYLAVFDASNQVETAPEFRPTNTSLSLIMYLGEPKEYQ